MKIDKNILSFQKTGMAVAVAGLLFTGIESAYTQAGYSSASFSMGKMRSQSYAIPLPDEVLVEEYMNYHRHNIELPGGEENVGFEMRLGNEKMNAKNGTSILQIGIATNRIKNLDKAPPVNVSIVIDRSGSMQQDNRLIKAKEAAREFVKRLRPEDYVSIVVFDHMVQTLLKSQLVGNRNDVLNAIERIQIGGSTDLHSGMMEGYKQVSKKYDSKMNNKVVLLTDAIANTGVVDPHEMIKNATGYHSDYKIDITMIGVGVDFNADLSRKLTKNSRSSIHFVHDAADIKKVFVDEVEAMLSPIAHEVKLEIEFDPSLKLEQFYGYEPKIKNHKIELDLDNINSGLTQIVMAKFSGNGKDKEFPISAKLSYLDIKQGKRVSIDEQISITTTHKDVALLADEEVKKNFMITKMAQTLKDMANLHQQGKPGEANEVVDQTVTLVDNTFEKKDDDVQRVYDILSKYDKTLNQILAQQSNTKNNNGSGTTTIKTTTTTVTTVR